MIWIKPVDGVTIVNIVILVTVAQFANKFSAIVSKLSDISGNEFMWLGLRFRERKTALLAALFFLAFLPLLVWIPTLFPHAQGVVSAAQAQGYNNKVAHFVAVGWALAFAVFVFSLARSNNANVPPADVVHAPTRSRTANLVQALGVAAVVLAIHFPPALALYGPYMEESIHLGALHRMLAGDVPFTDFEFLYGPLMLYASYYWTLATGYSLVAFYSYVALLEIIVFLIILRIVQRYLAGTWERLGAFLLFAALYFNPLIGPNQNGLRKVAGVALLLNVASRPWSRLNWVLNGLGVGALLSYSQDFGVATALGIAAIYLTLYFKTRDTRALGALAAVAGVSALTWGALTWALLGAGASNYFETLAYLTGRFDAGEAAFKFYWTASSIAVFGLLFLAIWHVANTISRRWSGQTQAGDLIFIGAIVYALVMLKSGLSRADQWHLVPAVLVLVFVFVLPIPSNFAPITRTVRRIGLCLSLVIAISYSIGHYPQAHYVFRNGLISGYSDILRGLPSDKGPNITPARPALVFEHSHPDPAIVALADFLAAPPQRDRRLFVYGGPWRLPFMVGATKTGMLGDDYIYGDDRGALVRAELDNQPDALIVIRRNEFEWLRMGSVASAPEQNFNMLGRGVWRNIRADVSSVHVPGVIIEEQLKKLRWQRLLGQYVVDNYHSIYVNGRYCILARNGAE